MNCWHLEVQNVPCIQAKPTHYQQSQCCINSHILISHNINYATPALHIVKSFALHTKPFHHFVTLKRYLRTERDHASLNFATNVSKDGAFSSGLLNCYLRHLRDISKIGVLEDLYAQKNFGNKMRGTKRTQVQRERKRVWKEKSWLEGSNVDVKVEGIREKS